MFSKKSPSDKSCIALSRHAAAIRTYSLVFKQFMDDLLSRYPIVQLIAFSGAFIARIRNLLKRRLGNRRVYRTVIVFIRIRKMSRGAIKVFKIIRREQAGFIGQPALVRA